nr:MAG TPA: hypothetical protein [Caudoviricetes sp.]
MLILCNKHSVFVYFIKQINIYIKMFLMIYNLKGGF